MYGPDAVINMAAFYIRRARGVRLSDLPRSVRPCPAPTAPSVRAPNRSARLYEGFVTKKCDGLRKAGAAGHLHGAPQGHGLPSVGDAGMKQFIGA